MEQSLTDFLGLSASLTGFGRMRLLGSGVSEQYLRTLAQMLPPGVLERLLASYRALPAGSERDAALRERILDDAELGPVARNVIVLWYCGTWSKLPDGWRSADGTAATDQAHVVSAAAYLAGLQWSLVGGHPSGGLPQGYGAWALPPEMDRR